MMQGPAKRPCATCPYRRDVPSGVWEPSEYARLPAYDNDTPYQPHAVFGCHQRDGRMCAGWVGCHDMGESLALRFAAFTDLAPAVIEACLDYATDVPLWGSGAEAAAHGMVEVEEPGERAVDAMEKIQRRRRR